MPLYTNGEIYIIQQEGNTISHSSTIHIFESNNMQQLHGMVGHPPAMSQQ